MQNATAQGPFSLGGITTGLLLAVGIRVLVQGLKEPVGSMVINIIDFGLDHAFPYHISITRHHVSWPLPTAYLFAGMVAIFTALCLGSRVSRTKPKPLPKQGL